MSKILVTVYESWKPKINLLQIVRRSPSPRQDHLLHNVWFNAERQDVRSQSRAVGYLDFREERADDGDRVPPSSFLIAARHLFEKLAINDYVVQGQHLQSAKLP